MYGYIVPDKMNMFIKDFTVYKAFYCGLCKSIGKCQNQICRFTTNYDMTFFNILMHNILEVEVQFNNEVCILNPLKKKSVVVHDELTEMVVHINLLLMRYKIEDDIIDNNSAKAYVAKIISARQTKKSRRKYPKVDSIIAENFEALRKLEQIKCDSLDRVSEPFSNMMMELGRFILGEKASDNILTLCYNLGKWVYLMDALDDLEEDNKDKQYNPFLYRYTEYITKEEYLNKYSEEIRYIMEVTYNTMIDCYEHIDVKISEGVLSNVFYLGIKKQTDDMLEGETKCKTIHL